MKKNATASKGDCGGGGGSGSAQKSHVKSQMPESAHEGHIWVAQRATWVLQYAAPANSVQGADKGTDMVVVSC